VIVSNMEYYIENQKEEMQNSNVQS
jgi:hypothetical protein